MSQIHEKPVSVSIEALHSVKSKHHQSHTLLYLNVKLSRACKTCPAQPRARTLQVWITQVSGQPIWVLHTYPSQINISDLRNYASSGSQKPPQWSTEHQRTSRAHKSSIFARALSTSSQGLRLFREPLAKIQQISTRSCCEQNENFWWTHILQGSAIFDHLEKCYTGKFVIRPSNQ